MTAPPSVRDEIRNWLTELLEEINEQGQLSLVTLSHSSAQGGETEIFALKSNHPKWKETATMAEILFAVASRHARGLPGFQQFVLHAVFGENTTSGPQRLLPFGLPGQLTLGAVPGVSPGGFATEAPFGTGPTQQSMRHQELVIQGAFAKDRAATEALLAINRDLQARLTEAQTEIRELWLSLRETFLKLMELEHKAQLDVVAAKQRAVLIQEFARLAPAAINGVTGRSIFPVAAGDTALLRSMLPFLDDDRLKMLAKLAEQGGQESQAGFAIFISRINDLRKEEEQNAKKIEEIAGEHIGNDYVAAAKDARGGIVKRIRNVLGQNGTNGTNGSNGTHTETKQLAEKPAAPAESKPEVIETTGTPAAEDATVLANTFGQAFIDAADAPTIATLAGMMRGAGKGDLADKMEEAFRARSK